MKESQFKTGRYNMVVEKDRDSLMKMIAESDYTWISIIEVSGVSSTTFYKLVQGKPIRLAPFLKIYNTIKGK